MQALRVLVAAAILSIGAGCADSALAPPTNAPVLTPARPTAPATPGETPSTRIEVTLRDSLTIEPAAMVVARGVPVTFVVTNAGALDHEFYLGDEQMQADHAAEMAQMGGMMGHDEPNGIGLASGETRELTFTFDTAGEWLAACHVNNHYAAGMRARITITE